MTSAVLARMLAAAADDDDGGGYVDTVAVHPDAHLLLPPGTLHFGNHSCDPSLWFDGPYASPPGGRSRATSSRWTT